MISSAPRTRRALSLLAVLSMTATFALTASSAFADVDTTAPTLTGISIVGQSGATPYTVDTTSSDSSVGVLVQATDAGSGVGSVNVTVTCQTGCAGAGDSTEQATGFNDDSAGPGTATVRVPVSIPQGAQTGTWAVTEVDLNDQADNTGAVTSLSAYDSTRKFVVSHTADTTAPALTSISLAGGGSSVNVSTTDQQVALRVTATDSVPGISGGSVTLTNGAETEEFDFDATDLQSGTLNNGTFLTGQQTFGWSERGTWTVDSVQLTDGYGNTAMRSSAFTFNATGGNDTTAPVAGSTHTLNPGSVNATTADAMTTLTLSITDNLSGLAFGSGEFQDSFGDPIDFSLDPSSLLSGTTTNGTYAVEIDVPARQAAGTYSITSLDLTDRAGNEAQTSPIGWPTLTVSTTADNTGPQLGGLTATPTPLNISANPDRSLSISAAITDDVSGFDHADVDLTDPGSNPVEADSLLTSSSQTSSGHFLTQFSPDQWSATPAGTWKITEVDLYDHAGNETVVTTGLPSFVVSTTAGTADTTDPTVSALTVSPASVSTSAGDATVHVQVTATDVGTSGGPASGVSGGFIVIAPPSGPGATTGYSGSFDTSNLISGDDTNGVYATDITIPKYAQTGTWKVIEVDVDDNAFNEKDLTGGDLGSFASDQVTVTGPSDTTAPKLVSVVGTPASVNAATDHQVSFDVHALDKDDTAGPGSGITSGDVVLTSPSGKQISGDFANNPATGSEQDGHWTVPITIPKFVQTGDWSVQIDLWDRAGNHVTYGSSDISALGAGNTSVVHITGVNDTTDPVMKGLIFSPSPVNTSGGPKTLIVEAHVTDNAATNDGSGVDNVTVDLASPHGTQSDFQASFELASGSPQDGWWTAAIPVPQFVDSGVWKVSSLDVTDAQNNEIDYNNASLTAASLPTGVTINGSADTAAPTVTSLTPPSGTTDVTTGSKDVTVAVGLTDGNGSGGTGSGVTSVSVIATGPNGAQVFGSASAPTTGSTTSGVYDVSLTIPQFTDNGTWHITEVEADDVFGNVNDQTTFGAMNTSFVVHSAPDTTGPTLGTVTLNPTTVDVGSGSHQVTVTASATDDASGVAGGHVEMTGPGGLRADGDFGTTPATGTATSGTFTASVQIPQYSPAGVWHVTELDLEDAVGNDSQYGDGGVAFPHTPGTLTVTDSNPDTVAPAVTGITVSPNPVDLSSGLQQVLVTLHATDALSGASEVGFELTSPTGTVTSYEVDHLADGTPQDGHWSTQVAFPANSENGVWKITEVDATDAAGNHGTSTSVPATSSFTVKNGVSTVPSAPKNAFASPVTGGVQVDWDAPDSNGGAAITGYLIRYSTNSGATWSSPVASSGTTTEHTVTGLTPGTSYVFDIAAVNSAGTSPYSTATNSVSPLASPPGAPTGVVGTPGDASVALSWTAPADNGGSAITGYTYEYSSDNGVHWSAPTAVSGTTAAVTGLTNGTSYVFQVAAANAHGAGIFSAKSAPVTPAGVPGAPTGINATPGDQSLALSWTAPTVTGGSPLTSYAVRTSTNGGTTWSTPISTGGTGTSYALGGLINGTAYRVEVGAVNAVGTTWSAPAGPFTPKKPGTTDPSALTIGPAATILFGKSTTVSGTLTDATTHAPIAGVSVVLQAHAGTSGTFQTIGTAVTSASGVASLPEAPKANTEYRWMFAGTTPNATVTSATELVTVSQVVVAKATPSKAKHGKSVKVWGTVNPTAAGQKVVLQQLVKGKWKTLTFTAKTKKQKLPNGKTAIGFVVKFTEKKKGSYVFRVSRAATATNGAGVSGQVKIKFT